MVEDALYSYEDRQRGSVAVEKGGEDLYQKLGVAVHNGMRTTSLANETEERAWEVFVPHSTELLGVNAEAIGFTDERAGHAEFVRAAATAEKSRKFTQGPTRRSTASIDLGSMTSGLQTYHMTRLPSQVETALEALRWCR